MTNFARSALVTAIGCALLVAASARAQSDDDGADEAAPALPAKHHPRLELTLSPKDGVKVGDVVKLVIRADALEGDDVAVPDQSFAPFEVHARRSRTVPGESGRRQHLFELELLAFEPGRHELPGIELRVVTKFGVVGSVKTEPLVIEVASLLGNEPNAQLKPATQPVVVMEDDYTLLYVAMALAAAALIALCTLLVMRYLARRTKAPPPPPPPRPPWEIAAMKLADLRRRKDRMFEEGRSAQFVDEVSDVVREYLGGRFDFDGLETTTDEMLVLLRQHNCNVGLWQEVAAYLRRCDLVKFANVEPDLDEADLVFVKAQDIVQFSMPLGEGYGAVAAAEAPPSGRSAGSSAAAAAPPPQVGRDEREGGT